MREGFLVDVELVLVYLKKNGGNINLRNVFGFILFYIVIWRNYIFIVRRFFDVGADFDVRVSCSYFFLVIYILMLYLVLIVILLNII